MQTRNTSLDINNFDLLRLLFAGTVCLVHAYLLSGFKELEQIYNLLSPDVAVKAFFVVSGFLIIMSYERSFSIKSYTIKRIRRIYPAYFCTVTLSAILFFLISDDPWSRYFSYEWLKFYVANLLFLNFLQPTLPGVFEGQISSFVNGALWTLKIEVMFYAVVPLIVFLIRKSNRFVVLFYIYIISVIYSIYLQHLYITEGSVLFYELARQLPGQLSYFMAGALFYFYYDIFKAHANLFLLSALLIYLLGRFIPLDFFEPIVLATFVCYFGLNFYLGNISRYGDFSYGIYILHYPIIQLLIYSGFFEASPFFFLFSVVSLTCVSAFAMWHLVEKRFLLSSSHYRRSKQDTAPT